MPTDMVPTKSQLNKAGKTLRKFMSDAGTVDLEEAYAAYEKLLAWRADHAAPLKKATMGLRSRVGTESCTIRVSQRLKRIPTILDKLRREPAMALSTMADIGGCRAVLDSIEEVRRIQARWESSGRTLAVRDYILTPRDSGYRAVHVIVHYDDRQIEVQLRTRVMHEWAYTVETMTGRLGHNIKGGDGPSVVQDWFKAVSEAMALEESGSTVDSALTARIARLRVEALPILKGGPH
ncbi:RelA/SpoT domain-containing protein [Nocardia brasiliensis]|uniref:RelA/SpoT domain-containing protein n=1 Tax=Nocardia brasiliensis TaxID=37326 RepID=UPI0024563C11|nr:RelA/SpoT domain-containing protein [Nocardia brasiliensis]